MNSKSNTFQLKNIGTNPYLWLVLITSGLFALLFQRFIVGEYAYFYVDMGADTLDINYPLYNFFSQALHSGKFQEYYLNVGLGMDMSSYLYQYINPINLLVLLLPTHLIPWGVLLATYVKLMLISIFGYKLFYKWSNNKWGSFIGALVWTFSGYVMLWGQHYGFCTSMVMFTIFFFLLHCFVEDKEKSYNWVLVLWITLMLFTNYYFLYMSGLMGACYVVFYLVSQKASWKKILQKLFGLAGMAALGALVGGVCLIPTLDAFTGSARADEVAVQSWAKMFTPHSTRKMYGILGRFFSNNAMGIGNEYTGSVNYYEIAVLSTSSLFCVAFPRLLMEKGMRMKTLFLTVVSLILVALPISGKIFNMSGNSQRWTFIICFMEAFAIAMAVKLFLEKRDRIKNVCSLAIGVVFTAVGIKLLFDGQATLDYELSSEYLGIYAGFLGIYIVLILMMSIGKKVHVILPLLMTIIVCVEMVVVNYPSINDRLSPTRNQLAVDYYNDGTKEVYEQLQAQDASLYRVAKSYESASENDSLVQGYPGLSTYMTTNPMELISIKEMYGAAGVSDNFAIFDDQNIFLNSLLGRKYLIVKDEKQLSADIYTPVLTVGNKTVYENQNALPFGYLYDSFIAKEQVENMEGIDRTLAALEGYYYTEDTVAYPAAEEKTEETVSLLNRQLVQADCQATQTAAGITIGGMGADPHIVLENVSDVMGTGDVQTLNMTLDVEEKVEMAVYYKTDKEIEFNPDQLFTFEVTPKHNTWSYTIPKDVKDLRIDVSTATDSVTLTDLTIDHCIAINDSYEKLKNTDITNISYADDVYQATVNNTEEDTKMLCVPLLYSEGWTATVDGQAVDLHNINSGLCGLELPTGSHEVRLEYSMPYKMAGFALSAFGILLYLITFVGGTILKKKRQL